MHTTPGVTLRFDLLKNTTLVLLGLNLSNLNIAGYHQNKYEKLYVKID